MHDVAAVQERHALGDLRSQRNHQRYVRRAGAAAGVRAQQSALYCCLRATRISAITPSICAPRICACDFSPSAQQSVASVNHARSELQHPRAKEYIIEVSMQCLYNEHQRFWEGNAADARMSTHRRACNPRTPGPYPPNTLDAPPACRGRSTLR